MSGFPNGEPTCSGITPGRDCYEESDPDQVFAGGLLAWAASAIAVPIASTTGFLIQTDSSGAAL